MVLAVMSGLCVMCLVTGCSAARSHKGAMPGVVSSDKDRKGPTRLKGVQHPVKSRGETAMHVTVAAHIRANFLLRGEQLAIGLEPGAGRPLAAFERLFLLCNDIASRVMTPDDLVDHVRITSEGDALAYVRLFTSPATVMTQEPPWWVEVVPITSVDSEFVLGRRECLEGLRRLGDDSPYRVLGVLTEEQWRRSNLPSPRVERDSTTFVIHRSLATVDPRKESATNIVCQVAERVWPNGRVRRQVLGRTALPGLTIVISRGR